MVELNVLKIRIAEVKPIELDDGKKFKAYKAVQKDGTLIDCKFTMSCEIKPTEPCYIIVTKDDCNISTKKIYPCLWVQNVIRIEPLEKKKSNVDNFFYTPEEMGDFEEVDADEDLPF